MADFGLLAGGAKTQRYNIPIEHLDFKYVSQCKDVRELEKIYRLLKSGEEGSYPDLTEHVAQRLKELAPKSRALRKNEPMLRPSDLDPDERQDLSSDLEHWKSSMREWQTEAVGGGGDVITAEEAPPPRKAKNLLLSSAGNRTETVRPDAPARFSGSKSKRVMPRSPDEWTQLEKQLEEQEEAEAAAEAAREKEKAKEKASPAAANKEESLPFKSKVPPTLKLDPLTSRSERQRIADDEKDKGNEAFRSGDFQEALVYYCRSLSVLPLASVRNNRALTYIKLKKWNEAIQDCNKVLKEEPKNVKALLRRATSLTEEHRLLEARRDTEAVLELEPDDSRAKKLLRDITAEEAERSKRQEKGSRRMQIEESSSEEEEEEEEKEEQEKQDKLKEGERRLTIEECEEEEEEEEEEKVSNVTQAPPAGSAPPAAAAAGDSKSDIWTEEDLEKPREETRGPPMGSAPPAAAASASKSDIWTEEDLEKPREEPSPLPEMPARPPPPPPPPRPPTKEEQFLEEKEKGNQLMKESKFSVALRCYDRCVELCPGNIIGHNNRALAHLRLENFNDAIYDCNMVLDSEPNNVKALFRRGLARKNLGDFPESLVDFRAAMMFDPGNASISSEIKEVQKLLRETGGRRRMRIQEIEEDEEEEAKEEKEEAEALGGGEEIPVIREAWPEGLARDWTEKAKEEMEKARKEVQEEKERLDGEAAKLGQELEKEKAVEEEMRRVTAQIEREKAELEVLVRANEKKSGRKPLIEEISPPESEAEREERKRETEKKTEKKEEKPQVQEKEKEEKGMMEVKEKKEKEKEKRRKKKEKEKEKRKKKKEEEEKEKKKEEEEEKGRVEVTEKEEEKVRVEVTEKEEEKGRVEVTEKEGRVEVTEEEGRVEVTEATAEEEAMRLKEAEKRSGSKEDEDAESGGSWVEVEEHMLREDMSAASISSYTAAASPSEDIGPVTPVTLMTALFTSQPSTRQVGAMLQHMAPERLPQFMTSQLDQKALSCLISALHNELLPRQKFDLVFRFLVAIRKVKRFEIVRMFLDPRVLKDLSDLFQVLEDIRASGHLPNVRPEDLSSLRASYSA